MRAMFQNKTVPLYNIVVYVVVVVVVAPIYPSVTGQRQTLTTERSAHFSLH